jgi:Fe-S oxidoreductase
MMSKHKYVFLKEFFDDVIRNSIEECVVCGECVRDCPVLPLTPLKDRPPDEIMQSMIDFLKDGVYSDEAYIRTFSCTGCGYCSDLCPQGIDPLLVHEAAKIELFKLGKKSPVKDNPALSARNLRKVDILYALQTKPVEVRWLKKVPSRPQKTENLVFLGCNPPAYPHKVFAFLDILEGMGVDFIALAGGELCCGGPYCPISGDVQKADDKARELVSSINAFSPERVINLCPGCHRQFTEYYPVFLDMNFEVQFYTRFLIDNLERIKFTRPLGKTVAMHESCVLVRRCKDSVTPRRLLEAIPGLNLVDIKREGELLCCGGVAKHNYPEMGKQMGHTIMEKAQEAGIDYLVSVCPGCDASIYSNIREYPFYLKDIVNLINEAMGGKEYEDKMDKFWRYGSIDKIIEASRETFELNGFTEEEMRQILPTIFPF